MTKRYLIALLALGLSLHVTGCTSSPSDEDTEVAEANDETFAEESEGDFAEEAPADGESEQQVADGGEQLEAPADEGGGDELSLDDSGTQTADSGEAAPVEGGGDDELSLDDDSTAVADGGAAPAPAEGGGDELALDDNPLPDDFGGAPADAPSEPQIADNSAPPPTDEPVFSSEPTPDDSSSVAETPIADSPSDSMGYSTPEAVASTKTYLPLLKVKDSAFSKAGANLNRVYVARPGDTLKGVSQKLYGSNRTSDLKAWNGFLSRGVKTGDKIYYASPVNPDDTRMLTYYEDQNRQPATYVSQEGDNIRKVSKQLLGYNDAWKEVWATNPNVESKGDIPAGIELRYWTEDGSAPTQTMAGAPTTPTDPLAPPTDMAQNGAPPPPSDPLAAPDAGMNPPTDPSTQSTDIASNGMPPPPSDPLAPPPGGDGMNPPTDMAGAGTVVDPLNAPPPPPPPPPMDAAPPAPPEPRPMAKKPTMSADESPMGDQENMMAIGFGGILLIAAAVLFVVIRKNRAKRMDLGQTQV